MHEPRYPVYVISKGRPENCLTARYLARDEVPFRIAVEPQEADEYAKEFGHEVLLQTPFSDLKQGGTPVRNFVWEHALSVGAERHWILDDNMRGCYRTHLGKRYPCRSGVGFVACENFVDRYENIAVAGMNYQGLVMGSASAPPPPFHLNARRYSILLIRNDLDFRWRGMMNEDTDLALTALARGHCTVLFNAFTWLKQTTMTMKGGNTGYQYEKTGGRLKMAKILERQWPYVVKTKRRFQRPQHVVAHTWRRFDTPLRLKPGVDLEALPAFDNLGMRLTHPGKGVMTPRKSKAN